MLSMNFLLTQESIEEVKRILNGKSFYINPNGDITNSMSSNVTLNLVFQHMTE